MNIQKLKEFTEQYKKENKADTKEGFQELMQKAKEQALKDGFRTQDQLNEAIRMGRTAVMKNSTSMIMHLMVVLYQKENPQEK